VRRVGALASELLNSLLVFVSPKTWWLFCGHLICLVSIFGVWNWSICFPLLCLVVPCVRLVVSLHAINKNIVVSLHVFVWWLHILLDRAEKSSVAAVILKREPLCNQELYFVCNRNWHRTSRSIVLYCDYIFRHQPPFWISVLPSSVLSWTHLTSQNLCSY
jgi:hypothetical protein